MAVIDAGCLCSHQATTNCHSMSTARREAELLDDPDPLCTNCLGLLHCIHLSSQVQVLTLPRQEGVVPTPWPITRR